MKLCVFPNDPLIAYYEKGEIKNRYYNPNNFFDEVHIISFIENDIDENKVQTLVGNARLKIHSVGKISIKKRSQHVDKIIGLVQTINPNVIRTYNTLLEGWFAAKCAKTLKIPMFLSIHTQYDHKRRLAKKSNLKKFFSLKYTEKFIEPYVIKVANKITIVYGIIKPYVKKHGGKDPELLYNRIDYERFRNAQIIDSLPKPLVLSVGNLIKEKNHECIINAMKGLDAYCLIIGKGANYRNLEKLIKKNNLENKITIKEFVPHTQIQNYYKTADVFALAFDPELEELPMPVMEAMATGSPIVIPFPKKDFSNGLEDIVVFSERNPDAFRENIKKILSTQSLKKDLVEKSLFKGRNFDNKKIEKREAEIYAELISKKESNYSSQ